MACSACRVLHIMRRVVSRVMFHTVDGDCGVGGGVVSLFDEVFIISM